MDSFERWAGPGSGLVGGVLLLVGGVMSDVTGPDEVDLQASGATIVRVVTENESSLRIGTSLLALGVFLLLWFFVWLGPRLDTGGGGSWASGAASISGVALLVLFALLGAQVRSLLHTPLTGEDEVIAKGVILYQWDYWRTFAPFVSAHLIGVGVAAIRGAFRPRFLGWLAIGVAFLPLIVTPGLMGAIFLMSTIGLSIILLFNTPPHSPATD